MYIQLGTQCSIQRWGYLSMPCSSIHMIISLCIARGTLLCVVCKCEIQNITIISEVGHLIKGTRPVFHTKVGGEVGGEEEVQLTTYSAFC